ncbi:acyl-ACP--UDP-N-acetylglucosamine O-acyltransferase [Rhodocytophaga aerolata]|uniref:Acyl-ACP--UDP-N-acetylglucosamine O-acyltransferase n=1 Tax=Rhodocytophaga aerolata TaxID=455078 RepID=A0ABT8R656_9BACT|nr:acyl-ACP--UDP-N-acetylglucosamine O-acyltransferase [Rhodocytophaga aerolata]MDO1446170.1 acyl-ACP--UDP-N-acetylglucosamine O-acyltransferase [Rhodocytophaga aerolata]
MNQPLAYIHPDAKIAQNVTIEPFTTIYKDVHIGEGTWIGPNVTIMEGARIGKNCQIYPGAVISAPPQDLKYKGEPSTVEIGDNTVIRECVTLNRGTALDKNTTMIGKNCLIMAYVHIAHDCIIGNNVIIVNSVQLAGHIEVQDYAFIGGASAVHQFVKVGAHAMISGGSLVRKDVPPYTKAGREPLAYCGINSIGLRRRGFTNEKINEIQEIYRNIYLRGMNNADAVDLIEVEMAPSKERDEILNFIKSSERGIMKGNDA